MHILIVTPAPPRSRKGNRVTAQRWGHILRNLGHRVTITSQFDQQPCDMMIALHARRSYPSIKTFSASRPTSPLIVVLTGTDLYQDLPNNRQAIASLQLATRLIVLQSWGVKSLPKAVRDKATVIYQSAIPPKTIPPPLKRIFEVSVIGHLRDVKDPFRAAMAVRSLPQTSNIRIVQFGQALSEPMARRARREESINPRYRWLGNRPHGEVMRRLARGRLTIISSKLEGGSNAISEAAVCGTPVVASRIDGNVGMLGEDYPGYFPVGHTKSLTELLLRAETDPKFLSQLCGKIEARKELFLPETELRNWQKLLNRIS